MVQWKSRQAIYFGFLLLVPPHNLQHNKTQLKLQKMVINNYQIKKSIAGTNHIILKLGKKRKKLEEKNKNTPLAVTSFI